jgi:hypothetical protein
MLFGFIGCFIGYYFFGFFIGILFVFLFAPIGFIVGLNTKKKGENKAENN